MKRLAILFAFLAVSFSVSAEIPWFSQAAATVNLRTEKVINGFYQRFEKIENMKSVLDDFDKVFKENAGINPRSDLRNIGLVVLFEAGKPEFVGYLEGKFNPTRILAEIEASGMMIPPVAKKKVELKQIAGKQVVNFIDEKKGRTVSACFFSNDLFFFAEQKLLERLVKGEIKFDEKPDTEKLTELKSELCLWIDTNVVKNSLENISHPAMIPVVGMLGMFNSLQLSIDKNDVKVAFSCIDKNTANNLKTFIEGQLAGYRMFIDSQLKNQKLPGKEPKWLPKAFSYLFRRSMSLMAQKSLEQTKVESHDSSVFLHSTMPPITESLLNPVTIGATGVLAAIAIPNFQKARQKAKTGKCFANQSLILNALRRYNADNADMITNLNQKVIDVLIKENYLPKSVKCPSGGKYISVGDLTENGQIKCTKHGAAD